jgi:hypothetical protein
MPSSMRTLLGWIRGRLLPALVTAAGVALLAAGLLAYQGPPEAVATVPDPLPPASAPPLPTLLPIPSLEPGGSAAPTAAPPADRVPTRIAIPALRIDLPIVAPPDDPDHFPYCDVAEYLRQLSRPGLPGATYIYAHARTGMFLPLLRTRDERLPGMLVQVYTSDDLVFLYEIYEVRRNQVSLDDAFATTEEELWLQTSEGPRGTIGKTQVIARPISVGPADPVAAKPTAKPLACE